MSDSGFCNHSASVLNMMISVLGVGHQGSGADWWWWRGDQVDCSVVTICLGVNAVQMLRDANASTIKQELRQVVALCCCGGVSVSVRW